VAFGTWVSTAYITLIFAVFWIAPARWRVWVLLVASYVFYAWGFPAQTLALAGLTASTWWVTGRMARSSSPRSWLRGGVIFTVLVLAVFKYADMAVGTFDAIARRAGWPVLPLPHIVAPLGISFMTFALIHYLVEVYRGAPPLGLRDFALYPAFFPTVISGPIKRYPQFAEDVREIGGRIAWGDVSYGMSRILVGLVKKLVLADTLANLTGPLAHPRQGTAFMLAVAVYAYTFQIYFDFAGYSDMAIGISRLFGFSILENFNWPYVRRNLAEFWSNWHISLTRFITEYVFIPLGGSRCGRLKTARNTLIAMAVSGLWHGAAWHFVAWGLWHGIGLVIVRWWRELLGAMRRRLPWVNRIARSRSGHVVGYGLGMIVTFNYVALGWVLFATSLRSALVTYERLYDFGLRALSVVAGRIG
jgi:alginate O-acetyltransferase complex protein AlgI